jgi:hypothetical protein
VSHHAPSSVWDAVSERDARQVRRLQDDRSLLERARVLPDDDQRLLLLALSGNYSYREIAVLARSNPGSVCRRVRRWLKRLRDPMVVTLLERPGGLSEQFRRIGLEHFLYGRGTGRIARREAMREAEVKAVVAYLGRWAQMKREVGNGGPQGPMGKEMV